MRRVSFFACGLLSGCVFWHLGDGGEGGAAAGGASSNVTGVGAAGLGAAGGGGAAEGAGGTLDEPKMLPGSKVEDLVALNDGGDGVVGVVVWTRTSQEDFLGTIRADWSGFSAFPAGSLNSEMRVRGIGRARTDCDVYVTLSPANAKDRVQKAEACDPRGFFEDPGENIPLFRSLRPVFGPGAWAAWTLDSNVVHSMTPGVALNASATETDRGKVALGYAHAYFVKTDTKEVLDWRDYPGVTGGVVIDRAVTHVATPEGPSRGFVVCLQEDGVCRLALGPNQPMGTAPLRFGPKVESVHALARDGQSVFVATDTGLAVYAQDDFTDPLDPSGPVPEDADFEPRDTFDVSGITRLLPTPDFLYFGYSVDDEAWVNRLSLGR